MIPIHDAPHNPGFQHLVDSVTANGALSPDFPVQCEPHNRVAAQPGCKWPEPPKRGFWLRTKEWAQGWGNWLLEVFSDGD